MVEFSDPKGPIKEGIDNSIFIVPGIIILAIVDLMSVGMGGGMKGPAGAAAKELIPAARTIDVSKSYLRWLGVIWLIFSLFVPGALIGFFVYKLVMRIREKNRVKEEKIKMKSQRKEKEAARKQKKR